MSYEDFFKKTIDIIFSIVYNIDKRGNAFSVKKDVKILSKRINLINYRKEEELTQRETAIKLGITARQYRNLESGTSRGSIKVWKKLKRLFNAPSIDFLLQQHKGGE
ncbi:MAG: helix-turn-helix transcriptional regulator [Anaerovoracaceae bacterium]